MKTLLEQLTEVSNEFGRVRKIGPSTVSRMALGDGQRLPLILAGSADLTTKRFERTIQWFSDNWPGEAVWPSFVSRPPVLPEPAPVEPAGAAA